MAEIPFPDPPLKRGSVLLRPWTRADVPWIATVCDDLSISDWSPTIPHPYSEADALAWLEIQEPERCAGRGIHFAVADASGRALGAISLNTIDAAQSTATVGYWLAARARGRGTMTVALGLLARWALDVLGLARLELLTDPENGASRRVAERCGFRLEGHLRSHIAVRHSGERRDSLVYGRLAD
jgi:[ribosomal protein S5]-alanine N-acetyltransferase